MFTTTHLILIGLSFVSATVTLVFLIKRKISFDQMMNGMVIVTIFSELLKVFSRIQVVNGAALLDPSFLPFHLCSIQIFFIWFLRFFNKKESTKKTLLAFMYPTCLFGGLLAILICTVRPLSFSNLEIIEYFGYHTSMIVLGLWIPLSHQVDFTFKRLVKTCVITLLLFYSSIYINAVLSTAENPTNFFYSAFPPLSGLPYLNFTFFGQTLVNEKLGWIWYLVKLMFVGIILIVGTYLPFLIKNRKMAKIAKVAPEPKPLPS